jgi:hypothetical protein
MPVTSRATRGRAPLVGALCAALVATVAACSLVERYDAESSGVCSAGRKACRGTCVGLDDPQSGCGLAACDPCAVANATARCSGDHACAVQSCNDGWGDCNGDPSDGCETNLQSDPNNCLSCGRSCAVAGGVGECSLDPTCSLTPCCKIARCEPPFRDCNQTYTDGCEIDTADDPANCGDCNEACPSGVCAGGNCQPAAGDGGGAG